MVVNMAGLGTFSLDAIGTTSGDGFSIDELSAYITKYPGWLCRFGVPDAKDLFRRMDLNRDGTCSEEEFNQWADRYARALSLDAPLCEFCQRPAAEKHCCTMCETSKGHAGHDMHCTGVAVAPTGYIWEKNRARDHGAQLERCNLKVGDRVEATMELRFKVVVPRGGLGTVFQLDDGILCRFDGHESFPPARVKTLHVRKVTESSEAESPHAEPGPESPWVLSVKYHGEWGERRQREISGQWDDAYCFGGPHTWPQMFDRSLPGSYNPNEHAQEDCGQNCLGRADRCGKHRLVEGKPGKECCRKSAWRWHLERHRRMLQVVEDCSLAAEQTEDLEMVKDICKTAGIIEIRSVQPPPLRWSYTGTTYNSGGCGVTVGTSWDEHMVHLLVEQATREPFTGSG